MRSLCFNPLYGIVRKCLLVSSLAIILCKVKCDETSFNDIIDFLPKEYFIKLFFDDAMQTSNLHEVRTPVTLQRYQNKLWTMNLTLHEKFFHYNRLIGCRTSKVMNIVQFNVKNYIRTSEPYFRQTQIDIFYFVRGPIYHGTNTHTIILGNEETYEMTSREVRTFMRVLGEDWIKSNVFAFNFQKQRSLWRVCGIITTLMELVCQNTSGINESVLDIRVLNGRTWLIQLVKRTIYYGRQDDRKVLFQKPVEELFVDEIVRRSNESLVKRGDLDWEMASSVELESKPVLPERTDSFVLIDELETNFLSCYSTPLLTFEMYVKPFELELWICIGAVIITISLFIYVYNRKKGLSLSFSPFFFFVSTLFEEPYSVPTALWNDSKFKTITIVWLLTAGIFTNLYTGQMITDLSIPFRGQALHSFEDVFGAVFVNAFSAADTAFSRIMFLVGNYTATKNQLSNAPFAGPLYDTFGCTANLDNKEYDRHLQQFRKSDHFALLQTTSSVCKSERSSTPESQRLVIPHMYQIFYRLEQEADYFDETVGKFHLAYLYYLREFFSPKYRHYPKHPNFEHSNDKEIEHYITAAVEKEIVACEKSIFLAESKELRVEQAYLQQNYPEIRFYVGNDTLEQGIKRKMVWNFRNQGTSKVPFYLKLLLQTGIRNAVLSIQSHKLYLQRREGTKLIKETEISPTLVNMKGPIQTVFIILAGVCSLAGLQFTFEVLYCRRKGCFVLLMYLLITGISKLRRIFTSFKTVNSGQ
jgi:hypothetical protein